jgi:putative transposase
LSEPQSARAKDDQRLLGLIKHSWLESGGVYGYRKIHSAILGQHGQSTANRSVESLKNLTRRYGMRCSLKWRYKA